MILFLLFVCYYYLFFFLILRFQKKKTKMLKNDDMDTKQFKHFLKNVNQNDGMDTKKCKHFLKNVSQNDDRDKTKLNQEIFEFFYKKGKQNPEWKQEIKYFCEKYQLKLKNSFCTEDDTCILLKELGQCIFPHETNIKCGDFLISEMSPVFYFNERITVPLHVVMEFNDHELKIEKLFYAKKHFFTTRLCRIDLLKICSFDIVKNFLFKCYNVHLTQNHCLFLHKFRKHQSLLDHLLLQKLPNDFVLQLSISNIFFFNNKFIDFLSLKQFYKLWNKYGWSLFQKLNRLQCRVNSKLYLDTISLTDFILYHPVCESDPSSFKTQIFILCKQYFSRCNFKSLTFQHSNCDHEKEISKRYWTYYLHLIKAQLHASNINTILEYLQSLTSSAYQISGPNGFGEMCVCYSFVNQQLVWLFGSIPDNNYHIFKSKYPWKISLVVALLGLDKKQISIEGTYAVKDSKSGIDWNMLRQTMPNFELLELD